MRLQASFHDVVSGIQYRGGLHTVPRVGETIDLIDAPDDIRFKVKHVTHLIGFDPHRVVIDMEPFKYVGPPKVKPVPRKKEGAK